MGADFSFQGKPRRPYEAPAFESPRLPLMSSSDKTPSLFGDDDALAPVPA
ncbi:hypothetical protein, partial [Caulobacter sp. CCH5-E12]